LSERSWEWHPANESGTVPARRLHQLQDCSGQVRALLAFAGERDGSRPGWPVCPCRSGDCLQPGTKTWLVDCEREGACALWCVGRYRCRVQPISAVLFLLEEVMGDMHAPVLGSIVLSSTALPRCCRASNNSVNSTFAMILCDLAAPVDLLSYMRSRAMPLAPR